MEKISPITEIFTYLGSTVRNDGGAGNDMNRLNKARNVFRTLNNVWKSSQYSKPTKIKLYQSCVLSTLLYGSECWRMTEKRTQSNSQFFSYQKLKKNPAHFLAQHDF